MTQGTLDKTATANSEREVSVQVPISSDAGRVIQETLAVTVSTGTASRVKSFTDFLIQRIFNPDQAWFWTSEWKAMEREASEDIASGRVIQYDDEEAFSRAMDELLDADL